MSESDSENQTEGSEDDLVPEDLQPSEDNPLAKPLPEDVDTDELDMLGGKHPEESSAKDDGQGDEGRADDGGDGDDGESDDDD